MVVQAEGMDEGMDKGKCEHTSGTEVEPSSSMLHQREANTFTAASVAAN